MGKLWKQAFANIKKTKSVSITLACLFLIAALLLNTGLLVILNYGQFFNSLKTELNSTDAYVWIPDSEYSEKVEDYFASSKYVKESDENIVKVLGATTEYNGKKRFTLSFNNMDVKRDLSKWKYVGKHLEPEEMSVYLPDIFKAVGEYKLNDKIAFEYEDKDTFEKKTIEFTIKGFTEDVFYSSTDTGPISCYVPESTYQQLDQLLGNNISKAHIVFANLDKVASSSKIDEELRSMLKIENSNLMASGDNAFITLDVGLIELSRCMMASIMSIMMVLFAVVIVVVCLLVVRFRIMNSLEEDILKIGSLKSIGYTNKQIIVSIILQFLAIAGLGGILGIAGSYPLLPAISRVFEQQSGLMWEQGFDAGISAGALLFLLAVVVLIVLIVARKVKKLTPVLALRGEMVEKRWKKNHYPLDKRKGNLSFALALKSILQNTKQNIMIIIIVIAVSFAGGYGVVMYYNTAVDTTAFAEIPGMEICNVMLSLNTQQDTQSVVDQINDRKEVEFSQFIDEVKVKVDDVRAACTLMNDFTNRRTNLVYEGHYPKKDGEIVLAGILAERINKKVGDMVSVTIGEEKSDYKITGLTNGSAMGGINCCMLVSDYETKNPEFVQQTLCVYLKEGYQAEDVINQLKKELPKDSCLAYVNFDEELEDGMASYQDIVKKMGIIMLGTTICVVALVLYFVISSSIVRKRRELGIQKAIGFTTFQLMNQFSLSFMVPVVVGTAIGSISAAVLTNPFMSIAMKGAGVMKTNFIVDATWIVLFGIGVTIVSYVLSLLITWRIRKISAYALVTE